jgi:hypothetical protein
MSEKIFPGRVKDAEKKKKQKLEVVCREVSI